MFPFYYFGRVTDSADPEGLSRVRVSRQGEEESSTDWIPVLSPWAGQGSGWFAPPETGSQVLVLCLDGREIRKVVIGGLWSAEAPPPETGENPSADRNADGKNVLRYVKSPAGSMLIFDDTPGAEKIQLIGAEGKSRLEFLTAEKTLSLRAEGEIRIAAKEGLSITAGEITIQAKKNLELSGENLKLTAKKNMKAVSDKELTVKGSTIALN